MNTQNKATTLQTKILALNIIRQHTKEIIEHETVFLLPLIGKNILKIDGSFKAKYEHESKVIEYKADFFGFNWWINTHYWFTAKYGKLTINVKTCVSGGGIDKNGVSGNCMYESKLTDLFNIDESGNLSTQCKIDFDFLNTVLVESEVLENAKKVENAAIEYQKIFSTIPHELVNVLYLNRLTR